MRVEINKWNGIRAIRWKRKEREKRDMGEEGVKGRKKRYTIWKILGTIKVGKRHSHRIKCGSVFLLGSKLFVED